MAHAAPDDRFIPPDFDPSDFQNIRPFIEALLERDLPDPAALERWLDDLSQLHIELDEYGTRRMIDAACHTDDPAIEQAYLHYIQNVQPPFQAAFFQLQQKFVQCPHRHRLDPQRWGLLNRCWQTDVAIFRPENIALKTEIQQLDNQVNKINGAMTVQFRGRTYTLQQMALFLEEHDRATRQEAWELTTRRRLEERDRLDDLFDRMFARRHRMALNAGFDNYRSYLWQARHRYFYSPEDCLAFGRAVEKHCMPMVEQLDRRRRDLLGLQTLRPWDLAVDPKGRPPLRPFSDGRIDQFIDKTRRTFHRLHDRLGQWIDLLEPGRHLDLDTRPAKRPGGFQASLEKTGRPFIFMNAAGTHRDMITMLHEAGHAFHFLAACNEPSLYLRQPALEFCEVASMSMELLAHEHFAVFYDDDQQAQRARRLHLEGIIRLLPWVATIDGFQHWLYTHPDHDRDQRTAAWLALLDRFGSPVVDYSGYEAARQAMWQRQGHLFGGPFYYIEYGIAQLGALGVWLNYRRQGRPAIDRLLQAFAAGGKLALPQLFQVADLEYDFSEKTIAPMMERVWKELETLPE